MAIIAITLKPVATIDKRMMNLEKDCCLFSSIRLATTKLILKIGVFNIGQRKELIEVRIQKNIFGGHVGIFFNDSNMSIRIG